MRFSLRWLGEWVDLPADAAAIADRLTAAGHEIAGIETVGPSAIADGEPSEDTILDVELTTNRPDCMNHRGLARELAALYEQPLRDLPSPAERTAAQPASDFATITVDDAADCPSYVALVIRGVQVAESPAWLRERLEAIGSRSINNVVDITNLVLWETGQPLHAFDLRTLAVDADGRARIDVRRARDGETLRTLDGTERKLTPETLVITDGERPVALAGIMGGFDTEVTGGTVDVLLEAAHFQASVVRKGVKVLDLQTDASHRFERGADPLACRPAAELAAEWIVRLAGGTIARDAVQVTDLGGDRWPPRLDLDHAKLCAFGGVSIEAEEVERILGALGFSLERSEPAGDSVRWRVTVPSWRWYDFDAPHAQDVYEEVLRVYGFDRIPATLPSVSGPDAPARPGLARRRRTQDTLAAAGFAEAIHYAFHDRSRAEGYPSLLGGEPVPLGNPLSDRYAVLRRSLAPDLVASGLYNQRRGADRVRLFEVAHVFARRSGETTAAETVEREAVALVCGGGSGTPWERQASLDFFDLKGTVDGLASALGTTLEWRAAALPQVVPGTGAEIRLQGDDSAEPIGWAGQIDDDELIESLYVAELLLDEMPSGDRPITAQAPSRFPGIEVDTTLTHALDLPWRELSAAVDDFAEQASGEDAPEASNLLRAHRLKDRYRGQGVPEGAINTTLTFRYESPERSLTQDEVNAVHRELAATLEERFGWSAASGQPEETAR